MSTSSIIFHVISTLSNHFMPLKSAYFTASDKIIRWSTPTNISVNNGYV